jgi:hypothetical protein
VTAARTIGFQADWESLVACEPTLPHISDMCLFMGSAGPYCPFYDTAWA